MWFAKFAFCLILLAWDDSLVESSTVIRDASSDGLNMSEFLRRYGNKMCFFGYGDEYKGEMVLHTLRRKIAFLGNHIKFHDSYYGGHTSYVEIIIKIWPNEVIKHIVINGTNSMLDVIRNYDLDGGVDYENGYIIEVIMGEPSRVLFKMNETDKFQPFANKTITLKIFNDKLLTYEFYEQTRFGLLLEWKTNFDQWNKELKRKLDDYVPTLNADEKKVWKRDNYHQLLDKLHLLRQDIHIIANAEETDALKMKFMVIEERINGRFDEVFDAISNVKTVLDQRLEKIEHGVPETKEDLDVTCASTLTLVATVSSLIPCAGTVVSGTTAVVTAICAIAKI